MHRTFKWLIAHYDHQMSNFALNLFDINSANNSASMLNTPEASGADPEILKGGAQNSRSRITVVPL